MLKHVLVPLDGSPLAEKALPYALKVVDSGQITLLSVVPVPDAGFYTVPASAEKIDQRMAEARSYLQQVARQFSAGQQVRFHTVTRAGSPADIIVEEAGRHDIEAVVMSTHGRSGVSRFIFGSVARKVLGLAHCPVFIVPVYNLQPSTES